MGNALVSPGTVTTLTDLRRTVIAAYQGAAHVNGLPHGDGATVVCHLCGLEIGEGEQTSWEDVGRASITVAHAACVIRASSAKILWLRGLLLRMEWVVVPERPEPFCPACTRPKSVGHIDSCWLAVELWRGILA